MITFEWEVLYGPNKWTLTLAGEVSKGLFLEDEHLGWAGILSANLAIASLLCRAADKAYQNSVEDERSWQEAKHRWTGVLPATIGPYPERQP